ncbi:MAG: TRAM domain-containing protein, partial [Lachnospiraceae bacterium]|nr:TRAM domain-containing protein [Lachnospiraceae bacterium]
MEKNDVLETEITGLTADGEGIGHSGDGMAFFVKGALPGDTVRAGVTALKKTFGYARLIEVLKPSKDRVVPVCPVAGKCGGCSVMPLSYEAQCRVKSDIVREDLIRLGG